MGQQLISGEKTQKKQVPSPKNTSKGLVGALGITAKWELNGNWMGCLSRRGKSSKSPGAQGGSSHGILDVSAGPTFSCHPHYVGKGPDVEFGPKKIISMHECGENN